MTRYDYTNYKLPIPAETVAASLEEIRNKHGKLTPEAVVTEAKDKDHILHKHFDWNNRSAAEKYRLIQARTIITCVIQVVETDTDPVQVRAFMKTSDLHEYKPVADVMKSQNDMEYVINQARAEMQSFIRKYRALNVLPAYTGEFIQLLSA